METITCSVTRRAAAVLLVALASGGSAQAAFVPPAGVTLYRLLFETSASIQTSTMTLAALNDFAAAQAGQNGQLPATSWSAVSSAGGVDATTNISCGLDCDQGIPIYFVGGGLVAPSAHALFAPGSGRVTPQVATFNAQDQFGAAPPSYVWTGSTSSGTSAPDGTTGTAVLGGVAGSDYAVVPPYVIDVTARYGPAINQRQSDVFAIYAISAPVSTVLAETAVPEPGTIALILGGLTVVTLLRRRF